MNKSLQAIQLLNKINASFEHTSIGPQIEALGVLSHVSKNTKVANELLVKLYAEITETSTETIVDLLKHANVSAYELTEENNVDYQLSRLMRDLTPHEHLKYYHCENVNVANSNIVSTDMFSVFGCEFMPIHNAWKDAMFEDPDEEDEAAFETVVNLCNALFKKYDIDAVCTGVDDFYPDNTYFIAFNS